MRLPARPGERLDRDREVTFSFYGKPVRAFEGDTFGSALYASGQRVFSRSFKYHRPRGLLCCSGSCANCMMTVDGVPNVRICAEPVREGAIVRPQNVLGSLEHDALVVTDKLGGPFTPVGFYYRTMIRPRWAWPLYEKFLRNVAGLGKLDKHATRANRYDVEHRRAEVLVVGGGEAGREVAREHAAAGRQVVLVDEGFVDPLEGVEVVSPGRALGIWEGGLVPVDAGQVLYRYRAERIVVATGTIEQPLVFPGNDLVGVMLPDGVRRLIEDWGIKPAEKAVVVTVDDAGREAAAALREADVELGGVYDLRRERIREIVARGRGGVLRSVEIDGRKLSCDLLVMSGGRQPAYSLLAQAGARVEYDPDRGVFIPTDIPDGIEAVGSVAGEGIAGAVPAASYNGASGKGKCFVCVCEDVTDKDLKRAIGEGFDSIELAKRYTTVTMGPCQGRLCHVPSIRLYARENEKDEATIGTTTARPPWAPVTLGLLAGRPHEPAQRTSIHHRHKELGAKMMWTGTWRRPHSYGDPEGEAQSVHASVGVIDVSTLGKMIVRGPDAAEFLERLYPNRFGDMKPMRIRYGVLNSDAGRIMDDGTIARLDDETFYVTTTSTGAGAVLEWFEWWNAVWGMDVEIVRRDRRTRRRERRRAARASGHARAHRHRPLERRALVPRRTRRADRRRALPDPPDRLRRRARLRAPLPEPVRRARLERDPRGGQGLRHPAVRPRAAADPPPREDAHPRRPGHRLGVQRPRGEHALDRQARQGRFRRQVVARARAGARAPGPPRRLRDGRRQGAARRRAGRPRRHAADRPDHELALEPRAPQGDRDGLGARRDRRGGQVVPRHRRRRLRARRRVRLRPFFDPEGERLRS